LQEVGRLPECEGCVWEFVAPGDILPGEEFYLPDLFILVPKSQFRHVRHSGGRELPASGRGVLAAGLDREKNLRIRSPNKGEQPPVQDALLRGGVAVNRLTQQAQLGVTG